MPYWLYNNTDNQAEGPHDTEFEAKRGQRAKADPFRWKIIPHGATNQRDFLAQYSSNINKQAGAAHILGMAEDLLISMGAHDPNSNLSKTVDRNNRTAKPRFSIITSNDQDKDPSK